MLQLSFLILQQNVWEMFTFNVSLNTAMFLKAVFKRQKLSYARRIDFEIN